VIKQDILEKRANIVYLGVGSNLGNKFINIEKAKIKLIENQIEIIKCSSYYETLSWPNPKNPKFLNIVLKIKTSLDVANLLKISKQIEQSLGRKKTLKNSPRECDIDILDFDNKNSYIKSINLPHLRMHKRNFVLIPLFEINKNWIHPKSHHHIKSLIFSLSNTDITSIKKI
tara:strand:+ start:4486 stop:5001 length:516 start_codon:yes stop_codon:yes gene_type:complete